MLEGCSLTRSYGQVTALRDVSVTVQPERIVSVLGPSGSGKSTLHRLLACLEPPTCGHVTLEGVRVPPNRDGAQAVSVWPQVTAVFQQLFLWPHLTLRKNILLPMRRLDPKEADRRLRECTDLFDMAEFLDRYPNETSGGQRQRAAIARAFALHPKYILLDEVTSALDPEQQAILADHLGVLKQRGIGILVITHSLDFARSCADDVIYLKNGVAVEQGPVSLLTAPQSDALRRAVHFAGDRE